MPYPLINAQTGTTYTFVAADAGKLVTLNNASAITLTIPAEATTNYAIGTSIDITQIGTGQVTIVGAAGVGVNATPSLILRTQYSSATCIKTASNSWIVVGDLQSTVPAFGAYQSTLQALAATTFTKLQFQTEEFDTNNSFDSTTNYRFTPTVAGYYQINAAMDLSGSSTQAYISIYKNGSSFKGGNDTGDVASAVTVSSIIYLNGSTDYVEAFGYTATALNTVATQDRTYFNGCLLRAG